MYRKLFIVLLVIRVIPQDLEASDPFSFVRKTLYLCQNHLDGTISNVHQFVGRSILHISAYIHDYFECVHSYWAICTRPHGVVSTNIVDHNISNRPCFAGQLFGLASDNFTLHIQVHQMFQINLTFAFFHLKHHMFQCKFHYIMVRKIHIKLVYSKTQIWAW